MRVNSTTRRPVANRFWDHVTATPDGCWLWRGSLSEYGYGRVSKGGRCGSCYLAHRVAWFIATGYWPSPEQTVCHTCDVPACVRHDDVGVYEVDGIPYPRRGHLFLASRSVNNQDKVTKDRQCRGDKIRLRLHPELAGHGTQSPRSKLTWHDVDSIRERWGNGGVTQLELSREYGVVNSLINEIISGKRWKFRLLSDAPLGQREGGALAEPGMA